VIEKTAEMSAWLAMTAAAVARATSGTTSPGGTSE
jgi:hypothetical protein